MKIDLGKWMTYNADTEELIFPDGSKHSAPMEKGDTPESKAMLEWAEEYIKILEGKKK